MCVYLSIDVWQIFRIDLIQSYPLMVDVIVINIAYNKIEFSISADKVADNCNKNHRLDFRWYIKYFCGSFIDIVSVHCVYLALSYNLNNYLYGIIRQNVKKSIL